MSVIDNITQAIRKAENATAQMPKALKLGPKEREMLDAYAREHINPHVKKPIAKGSCTQFMGLRIIPVAEDGMEIVYEDWARG